MPEYQLKMIYRVAILKNDNDYKAFKSSNSKYINLASSFKFRVSTGARYKNIFQATDIFPLLKQSY